MKRRTALKYLGALAGAAAAPRLVTGCSTEGGQAKDPRIEQGITTLVVLCLENRSYDHYLGARSLLEGKGGDGLRAGMGNPDPSGRIIAPFHTGAQCIADPPHGWDSNWRQFNGGRNDGFITEYEKEHPPDAREVMGYMTRQDIPVTYALADAYTSCDRWFCSLLSPTWPNRMYLHSAQSGGLKSNTLAESGGFGWPSIWHRLNEANVPWGYYFSNVPFVPLFKNLESQGRIRQVEYDFFDDAQAGKLPPVTFIDPAWDVNDDHPPNAPLIAQQLIAAIYEALARSPQWPNVLFVITYDEHGGFFDHVPPPRSEDDRPADGFAQLGFRVPTLVIGPYVKQGHVSNTVYDHTSVLAHIEKMFSMKPLTRRDAAANDLGDAIDKERLAARDPLPPIKLPEVVVPESVYTGTCAALKKRSELVMLAEAGHFGQAGRRRPRDRDILYAIGERLEAFGAGGYVKGK